MKRSIIFYVQDILDAITYIERYVEKMNKQEFEQDPKTQDAVIRRIEIIGEAAKHIPESFRNKYTKVPWKKLSGIRDVLIHAYLEVKIDRIWKITQEDIPLLKQDLSSIVAKESNESSLSQ